jgi:hypothetical protein
LPVGSRSDLVSDRVQEQVLHQTLIEVQSRLRRNCREREASGSKLNYTLYKRQIKLVNSDLTIGFQKKKAKS